MSDADFRLDGRRAVVTGAARGIGRAIAERLAVAGAHVVVADRDEAEGNMAVASIEAAGGKGAFSSLDVTDPGAVARAVDTIYDEYGPVDVLVNNAGIVRNAPALEMSLDDWKTVIDIDLGGIFHCAQAFGRRMVAAGRGSMVNISSICGEVTVYPQPQVSYNAAKAGVNLLTKSLAVEWAKSGVRVNAVAPGYVGTELTLRGRSNPEWFGTWMQMTPMGRLGEPREIANAVLFLAADASSYITGTVLTIDGGYTAL
ncbi:SDR family oxidoreductase [Sinorhizobium medicae]|uniref:3-oxoacyl-(Acyl-carrier-protein) reductase n=1 Tax=Sinorhizobium medicae TaxID=110321 RepID=A0A508WYN0_9HYPH|nr:SDR family oxidoreductase [Sinorhizobium medicae]MDX0423087.1 SDR family oxidoreductase [Sinorhizobium medicae]MDX0521133.1 SDR family oxidoreductase [Sinorhizobium medicae]MDX0545447.1 SDR family oxidoreductase [Sinorhizobium medicae]MDX0626095.1 SDR family oxidoreductase [Sinorhizobium medicae]MDX0632845.1 SDR family oxidoreductase [Sinorhizobium medicae]